MSFLFHPPFSFTSFVEFFPLFFLLDGEHLICCSVLLNGVSLPGRRHDRDFGLRQPPRPRPTHLNIRPQETHHGFPVPQGGSGQAGSRQSQRPTPSPRAPPQRSQTPRSPVEDDFDPTPGLGVPSMAGLRMRREEFAELAQLFTGLELDPNRDRRNARSPNVPHLSGGIHAVELTPHFWQTNRPSSSDDGSLLANPGTSNRQDYFDDVAEGAQGRDPLSTPTSVNAISAALDQSADDPDSRPQSSASTASLLSVGELLRELGSRSIRPLNTFVDDLKAKVWSRLRRRRK